jgi:PAS domain S-box-containing protein
MIRDTIHVLQVADDETHRANVTAALTAEGFDVTAAATADEARAFLDDSGADCVVAAADVPDVAGFVDRLRRPAGDYPCVVLVARRTDPLVEEVLAAGATDVCVWDGEAEADSLLATRVRNAVDRHRSTRELRTNERRFDQAQKLARVGSWEWDIAGGGLSWSDEVYRIFGHDPDEFEASYDAFLEAVHPQDRERVEAAVERAVESEEAYDIEHRIVRTDGEERVVREHGEVTVEDGEPVYMLGTVQDVTDRARREQQLERYRNIVESLPVGVWRTASGDADEFLEVNPEMVSLLGADSESELLERDPRQFYKHEADREEFTRELVENGIVEQHEVQLETLDGEELWGSITAISRESDGGGLYFDGMVVDVTERKELQRERERSEKKFRAFAETSYDSFYRFDPQGRYTYASPATKRVTGYEPEELLGEQFSTSIHPDDHETAVEAFDRVLDGDGVEGLTLKLERKDGTMAHASVNVVPIREDGEVVGVQGIARDVTERVERERELEYSRKKFRTLLEAAPDAIVIADAETGEIREVNRAAEDLFDRPEEELIGAEHAELHPAEERERYRRAFAEALDHPRATFEQFENGDWVYAESADGRRVPVEINTRLIELDDRTLIHGIFRDISGRKAREEELRDYRDRLEKTIEDLERSNQELEQFAYVASHDLQEPLRMVSSYLDLLAAEYEGELDEEADEYIEFAVDGAERMRQLINDLLKFSRVQTHGGEFEPTDPEAAFEEALTNLAVAIDESDAEITRGPLPEVEADRNQLVQLFQNLVSNAIEYAGDGPPQIHVEAERRDDAVVFSVADEGVGIDPDQQERIFEIFTRGTRDDDEDGTGVGLAICKRIVHRHGGDIEVDSAPGEGTTFTFTIPEGEPER